MKPLAPQLLTVLLLAAAAAGCGGDPNGPVAVAGRVTIDGEPLTRGTVRFVPPNGRQSTGKLDDQGRFELTCFKRGDGALRGKHRVTVISSEYVTETKAKWHAPERYANAQTSELEVTIDGQTDDLLLELEWGDEKGPVVIDYGN